MKELKEVVITIKGNIQSEALLNKFENLCDFEGDEEEGTYEFGFYRILPATLNSFLHDLVHEQLSFNVIMNSEEDE